MKMRLWFAAALVMVGCGVLPAMAQGAPKPAAAGAMIEPSKSFDDMLTGAEKEVMGAAKAMPADKYSFAPTAATFAPGSPEDFKGVRTFAQQLTHIAEANYYYGGAVGKMKTDDERKGLDKLTGKEEVLAALQASFDFVHKAIATLTVANAFESVHAPSTRASLAGGVVAHSFDHYGQLVEYLRMNGIVPPASVK